MSGIITTALAKSGTDLQASCTVRARRLMVCRGRGRKAASGKIFVLGRFHAEFVILSNTFPVITFVCVADSACLLTWMRACVERRCVLVCVCGGGEGCIWTYPLQGRPTPMKFKGYKRYVQEKHTKCPHLPYHLCSGLNCSSSAGILPQRTQTIFTHCRQNITQRRPPSQEWQSTKSCACVADCEAKRQLYEVMRSPRKKLSIRKCIASCPLPLSTQTTSRMV